MKNNKTRCVIGLYALMAVVPAGNILASLVGCELVFARPWLIVGVLGVSAIILTVLLVLGREKKQALFGEILAMLLPPVSEVVLLAFVLGEYSCLWIVGGVFFACAVVGAVCCYQRVWTGVVSFVLALPLLMPIALLGLFAMMPMSQKTVLQTAISPDGTYIAQLIDDDQGALGGATIVNVRKTDRECDLLIFALQDKPDTVYCGDWGEGFDATLVWTDDKTLCLNEKIFTITY